MSPVGAQNLNGYLSSGATFINGKNEDTTTELQNFQQVLDLNWNKIISPVLTYRLTFRTDDARNKIRLDSDTTKSSTTSFEPILDATLSGGPFSLHGGLRFREVLTDGNKQDRTWLNESRWFTRLFLTPENWPSLSFQVDRATQKTDTNTVDKSETRYQLLSSYNYNGFTFSGQFSDTINKDFITQQNREQQTYLGTFGYTRNNWGGWLDVLGGYSINYAPTREEFKSAGTAEVPRQLQRGLRAGADLTPEDSADVPMVNDPALISGTASVPLELNTSIGFEQTLTDSVSQIRVNLSPEPPFTLPDNLTLFLSFRVFFTNDLTLTTWTELGGVTQTYNVSESRFELNFPATTARSFKIYVSRNDFGALVRATGISAFNLEAVTAGTSRTRSTLAQSLNGNFTVRPPSRPWTITTLSYDFYLSHITQEPESQRNFSGNHTARITAEPYKYLTTTLSYQHTFTNTNQTGSEDTTQDFYNAVLIASPLPTLTGSLSFAHNDNRSDSKLQLRSDTGTLNVSGRLYRNLNLDSTYTLAKTHDFENENKSLSHGATINGNAILTPRLNVNLGYTFRWVQSEPTDQSGQTTVDLTHTISSSFTYTVSRFININGRYNYFHGKDANSFTQDYRLDWTPTSQLTAFLTYRRTQSETSGDRSGSDAININGRWNISRYFSIDGNFTFFRTFEGNRVNTLSARATFRF